MAVTVYCPFCHKKYGMIEFSETLCPNCERNELVLDRETMEPMVNLHSFLDGGKQCQT